MRSGEDDPFIAIESVRSALDSIIHVSTVPAPNPLERLLLVDEFLTNPDLPDTDLGRQFALNYLLTSIIREEYWRLLSVFEIEPISEDSSLVDTLEQRQEILQVGGIELAIWNLLYLRYVRSDLGLTLDSLGQSTHADARTLRRYMRHAFEKLTKHLIGREWAARHRQRERRLLNELPSAKQPPLVGRQDMLQDIHQFLAVPGRHHILVTGQAGIGKSTLVQEALREQIARGVIDYLTWILRPPSAAFIRHHLIERLIPEGTHITLSEFLLLYPIAIVLDSVEAIEQHDLETLLDELSAALVFITTREPILLHNITRRIVLKELGESDSLLLFRSVAGASPSRSGVYWKAGGNPLAIKLATQMVDDLPQQLLQTLGMMTLFPFGVVNVLELFELWPDLTAQIDITPLVERHLVESITEDQLYYRLPATSREYVEQCYAQSNYEKRLIDDLLYGLKPTISVTALKVVEQALLSPWLDLDLQWQRQWIELLWSEGIDQGHGAIWCSIFEHHLNRIGIDDPALLTPYGVCLRRLTQWNAAENIFQHAISLTGLSGTFLAQARVLLELGILYKNQGYYEKASHVFSKVETTLQKYPDNRLASSLRLQQAQIALESKDAEETFQVLSQIQVSSPAVLALRSEAHLLMSDCKSCLELAQKALEAPDISPAFEAHVYSIIGRSYEQCGEFALARRYLESAVTLLERADDRFVLARVQSNLGAVLIQFKAYPDARRLLEQAASAQLHYKDQLGLAMTRHNLRVLHIAQV
jgi:tetratricopeptide (TPR) repeat protein